MLSDFLLLNYQELFPYRNLRAKTEKSKVFLVVYIQNLPTEKIFPGIIIRNSYRNCHSVLFPLLSLATLILIIAVDKKVQSDHFCLNCRQFSVPARSSFICCSGPVFCSASFLWQLFRVNVDI